MSPRWAGWHRLGNVLGLAGTVGVTYLLKQKVGGKIQNPMGTKSQLQPELGELNRSEIDGNTRGGRCFSSTSHLVWGRKR